MAAKRRHQNTSAPENGRTKQTLQVSGKTKTHRKRDRENGHTNGDVTEGVSENSWKYVALVGAVGKLFTCVLVEAVMKPARRMAGGAGADDSSIQPGGGRPHPRPLPQRSYITDTSLLAVIKGPRS